MKRFRHSRLLTAAAAVTVALLANSCEELLNFGKQGTLTVSFLKDNDVFTKASGSNYGQVPDTNDFIIEITDSKGKSIFSGSYGSLPSPLPLDAGTYTISAKSCIFEVPMFNTPQYGDIQNVTIKSSQNSAVELICTQLNAGMKLTIGKAFLTEYPDAVIYLKSSDGKLMYSYTETRTAFFNPGNVSVVLVENNKEKTLVSKNLAAQQILSLSITLSSGTTEGNSISISLDTSRIWLSDIFNLGGSSSSGDSTDSAFGTGDLKSHVGKEECWVYGYIVGGDLSSSRCSFETPFTSRTNIVLAAKSSCKTREDCISVQLAKGDIRDELNLVDHEENLGRQIFLKGDIVESYYGLTGIQNISEYKWK